jgi:hypothetical protein
MDYSTKWVTNDLVYVFEHSRNGTRSASLSEQVPYCLPTSVDAVRLWINQHKRKQMITKLRLKEFLGDAGLPWNKPYPVRHTGSLSGSNPKQAIPTVIYEEQIRHGCHYRRLCLN